MTAQGPGALAVGSYGLLSLVYKVAHLGVDSRLLLGTAIAAGEDSLGLTIVDHRATRVTLVGVLASLEEASANHVLHDLPRVGDFSLGLTQQRGVQALWQLGVVGARAQGVALTEEEALAASGNTGGGMVGSQIVRAAGEESLRSIMSLSRVQLLSLG